MPLPEYPTDPVNLRRARYALPLTSPEPLVGTTPDSQVISLDSVRSMRIGLQAEPGQTLTGSGTLRVHHLDPLAGAGCWGPNPGLDMPVPPEAAGKKLFWMPDVQVLLPVGRMHLQTDGVGVSGGSTVTVHVLAWVGP